MTAPELVEVVARTIYEHSPELDQTACPTGYCTCNQRFDTDDEVAAHQARAVLAALTEAGTVEWGALHRGRKVPYRYAKEQDARNSAKANRGVLVSRPTFPWTAVTE